MELSFKKIKSVTDEQKLTLISKLESAGFEIRNCSVYVKEPKINHPKWQNHFLPVGFLNDYAELVNLDEKFPEDYHSQLKEIYNSI